MARARSEDFKTATCRISYAFNLFKPQENTNDAGVATKKWGATLIFPKIGDRTALDKAVQEVIVAEWGEKGLARAKAGLIRLPYLDGAGKEAHNQKTGEINPGLGPDVFFIRPTSNKAPAVFYKSRLVPATSDDIPSGCYGFAVLNAYAWNNAKNGDGVSFGIQMFQRTGDGESLGGNGSVDVDKWYEKIEDTGAAPAATKTGAGAGGLFG